MCICGYRVRQPEVPSSFSSSAEADVLRAQLADERQQNEIRSKQNTRQFEEPDRLREEIGQLEAKRESPSKPLAEVLRLLLGSKSER